VSSSHASVRSAAWSSTTSTRRTHPAPTVSTLVEEIMPNGTMTARARP